MKFLDKSFSTYVEFLNIDAVYRLQIISIMLSIIAIIATAFGILANWEDIISVLKSFSL